MNYIETYYNRRRPHSTIDYQIPAQACNLLCNAAIKRSV